MSTGLAFIKNWVAFLEGLFQVSTWYIKLAMMFVTPEGNVGDPPKNIYI